MGEPRGVDTAPNEGSVEYRLDRIEALLREHRLHEGACTVRRAQVHNSYGGSFMLPGECDCWLSAIA